MSENPYLLLDLGSLYIKAGFSGEGYPRLILPSVVGYSSPPTEGNQLEKPVIAEEALYSEQPLHLIYPFQDKEWNWLAITDLISYIYQNLGITSNSYFVLYLESSDTDPENTDRLVELLKTDFLVPKIFVVKQRELILHALYRKTGIVIELGYSISSCMVFYEGFQITSTNRVIKLNGLLLTKQINDLLEKKGGKRQSPYEIAKIIENNFYAAINYEREIEYFEKGYGEKVKINIDDGASVEIGQERFLIPEIFFQPQLIDLKEESLTEIIYQAIMSCTLDTRPLLVENIILSGGTSKLKKLDTRLREDLQKKFPNLLIKIVSHQKPELTAWLGADILCSKGLPPTISR